MSRLESGAVQFGEDWPGLFIRGDRTASLAMALTDVLTHYSQLCKGSDDFKLFAHEDCKQLARMLALPTRAKSPRLMKPYEECRKGGGEPGLRFTPEEAHTFYHALESGWSEKISDLMTRLGEFADYEEPDGEIETQMTPPGYDYEKGEVT